MGADRVVSVVVQFTSFLVTACCLLLVAPDKPVVAGSSSPPHKTLVEPAGAAAFVAAYSRGDETGADRVSSPLYRAEWARRGLSAAERETLRRNATSPQDSTPTLRFTFIGGRSDDHGFAHLLYVSRADATGVGAAPAVWRIDTDPDGLVIWAEIAWLFTSPANVITAVGDSKNLDIPLLPDSIRRLHPRVIAGARSGTGADAFYEATIASGSKDTLFGAPFLTTTFFGVDRDGNVRPGVWSYGQANTGPSNYGHTTANQTPPADRLLAPLEESYASSLQ